MCAGTRHAYTRPVRLESGPCGPYYARGSAASHQRFVGSLSMPRFAYSARDASGRTATDEVTAPSRKDALRLLTARGLRPLQLNELTSGGKPTAKAPTPAARNDSLSLVPGKSDGQFSRAHFLPFLQALSEL